MGEDKEHQPTDSTPLSEKDLARYGETLLASLLRLVQDNHGFDQASGGDFDFTTNSYRYVGKYRYTSEAEEDIDMTRSNAELNDRAFIRKRNGAYRVQYFNNSLGKVMQPNTYGSLRGSQGIIQPPGLQAQEA